jgi:hypothetical protein
MQTTAEHTLKGSYEGWVVHCPTHGEHPHVIHSNIPSHTGVWCQLCWLESLGAPLPSEFKRIAIK